MTFDGTLQPFDGKISTKLSGAWFPVTPYVKNGGSWVAVEKAYAKKNGEWRRCY